MHSGGTASAVIGFDANDWVGPWMNRQQILSRLAQRGWSVWYSTGAPYRWEIQKQRDNYPIANRICEHNGVNVACAGRFLPRWPRFPLLDRLAVTAHGVFLRRQILRNGNRRIIAHVFNPEYEPYVDALKPDYLVFHLRDDFQNIGHWDERCQNALERLARRADLLIVSSHCMLGQLPASLRPRARELANGADVKAFAEGARLPEPEDLVKIPHPRIGYIGALSLKFDWDMLLALAEREVGWHWVLVGPMKHVGDTSTEEKANRCIALPNVHWLGTKLHTALPAYVAHCDVNVMLYRVSDGLGSWARSGSPLKLHEYLASGQPVVGSCIPSVEQFRHVVAIPDPARGVEAWREALSDAIRNGGVSEPPIRYAVAADNSWDLRVTVLEGWYQEMIRSAD